MAYASLAEMRAMEGLSSSTDFPDATVNDAVTLAEAEIDDYTMTSWEYKPFTAVLDGTASRKIWLVDEEGYPILFPRTVTAATIDGVAATTTGWKLHPSGLVITDDATFSYDDQGQNISIAGTAGKTNAVPTIIAWATRKLARFHLLTDVSRINEQAIQAATDFGTIQLAQASNQAERPTSLPEVNARLARHRQGSRSAFG